jgi:hypothetical protein
VARGELRITFDDGFEDPIDGLQQVGDESLARGRGGL